MADPRSLSQTVTVASFRRYEDARRVVERLADLRFPVERTSIVARELRVVEHGNGRVDAVTAVGQGAVSGAVGGAVLGLVVGLFDLAGSGNAGSIGLPFWGLLIGALTGALVGRAAHALTPGHHDLSSAPRFEAGQFALVADASVAEDAARMLHSRHRAA